ncbi:hypothetical protein Glove_51g25 [Diversispora epigaea]|uniref:Uncharacterized protein n=1 Tax=Diversispora epigaea TaxID=1348612 RepID=A0A397JN60_9GLOM|nr:hypothetical protein Glove_51g25 [Diversispora epigaea]
MSKYSVILVDLGKIVEELHYGPYSRYWWTYSNFSNYKNHTYFPIRLGQKTCTTLNEHYFFITVQINKENSLIPQYYCECNNITSISSSSSTAISNLYKKIFKNATRYSGPLVMGWDNEEIVQKLYENIGWIPFSINIGTFEIFVYSIGASTNSLILNAGNGYKSSLINIFERKQAIFVSKIENKTCKIEIYQDSKLSKIFVGTTPEEVWKKSGFLQKYHGNELFGLANEATQKILHDLKIPNCLVHEWNNIDLVEKIYHYYLKRKTLASIDYKNFLFTWQEDSTIIELYTTLKKYYPKNYKFNERELSAWYSFLQALGCTNITPWFKKESEFALWSWFQFLRGRRKRRNFLSLLENSLGV